MAEFFVKKTLNHKENKCNIIKIISWLKGEIQAELFPHLEEVLENTGFPDLEASLREESLRQVGE